MPEITFNQAKEFLDNITSEDKVAVIHHDDGDGFCSGILYYDWCKKQGAEVEQFTYELRKSSFKDFNLEKFNKLIVCDLAPYFVTKEFELVNDKQILYSDHHPRETPVPKEILELVTVDQGYIPSSRTAGELTGIKPWLSLIGTITDAGHLYPENQKFIEEKLKALGMTIEKFREEISSVVTNTLAYFDNDPEKAFSILDEIDSIEEIQSLRQYSEPLENEIEKFIEEFENKKEKLGDVNFYYFNPHFKIKKTVAGIISQGNPDEAFIFASTKEDGKHISLSGRNAPQDKDMLQILRAGVEGLEDGNAGGHHAAAGGMILAKDLEKFKKNIRNYMNS
jgi:single-stranded DNA-specific DHH superfamily exonuclease